jgi:hypothetical protein
MRRVMTPPVATPPPVAKQAPAAPPPANPDSGAIRLLALLQREGRLLDFLYEDLSQYSDDKVGAVVRGVHEQCRRALDSAVELGPVVDGVEGTVTNLASAQVNPKDTAKVKLMGNVPADGKAEAGILQHKGWKVKKLTLPAEDASSKANIVAPAEIEVE